MSAAHAPEAATATLLGVYLQQLRLPAIGRTYQQVARDAAQAQQSYAQFLLAVLEQEVAAREVNRQRARLAQAKFPVLKTLECFEFEAVPSLNKRLVLELTRGHFITEREVLVLLGGTGTGKTHVATGLGVAACQQGRRVRFLTATGLVNRLLEAHAGQRVEALLASFQKVELVIVDELGFVPFSAAGAELLFGFFADCYERRAVIVTSNLPFPEWTTVFGNERLTAALLDRLTHRCQVLEFRAESFRLKQSLGRQRPAPAVSVRTEEGAAAKSGNDK